LHWFGNAGRHAEIAKQRTGAGALDEPVPSQAGVAEANGATPGRLLRGIGYKSRRALGRLPLWAAPWQADSIAPELPSGWETEPGGAMSAGASDLSKRQRRSG